MMDLEQSQMADGSLGEKLERLVASLPPTEVTLSKISESIGDDSRMFFTLFLALFFLIPVSIPGISTVLGGAILLIGISHLLNRKLWLPRRIADRAIASEKLVAVLNRALLWFRRFERISRPGRFHALAREGKVDLFNKLSGVLAAVLLMAPFGFIPFSNTLPAAALIFLALGALQKDGLCIFCGHLSNLATLLYFAVLLSGGGMTLVEVLRQLAG